MRAKRSLGQNFLNDPKTLKTIVDQGNIKPDDIILEIGPGTGNLTDYILKKKPKKFIVVEKDRELSELLKKKYGKEIEVINEDILYCYKNFSFSSPIKVFGNLPYNISTKILISLLKIDNLNVIYDKFIFIFQKEVADRIIAEENTKNYGRLSILTSWKMNKSKIIDIDPSFFFPKPKIWSSLITLTPKANFQVVKNVNNLEHITNVFFNQRRKMIKKPMKQLFKNFNLIAKRLSLDLNLRPQNLSKNKYIEICKIYESLID
tara:strand:- start:311 stop:1096 length:786 start_codon:yes stop_codon:yes gene_type:complete